MAPVATNIRSMGCHSFRTEAPRYIHQFCSFIMSTYKAPTRKSRRQELREDKVVTLYSRFIEYFEENRNVVFGVLGAVILLLIMGFGYGLFKDRQEDQAQDALARAVRMYEAGQWREALDGADGVTGLLEVADRYGGSKAGNLALFYTADAYFKLGEVDQALTYFQRFDHDNDALGAGAYAGEAAIHESKGDYLEAAQSYMQAATIFESDFTSARYLELAGRNFEKAGQFDEAREAYETIKDTYPESTQAGNVDMFLARVNILENKG